MQHSSLARFCDECGLANELAATHCAACQHPLVHATSASSTLPITPMVVAPPPVREVMAGQPLMSDRQSMETDFPPGTILAERYQIEEEIGRGGFSIVYRCIDLEDLDRSVAIKRIPLSLLAPSQIIDATETFNREVLMLTRFAGTRGVPEVYENLADQENWYLVMEYIEGQTLEECLQHAPDGYFDEEQTLRIGVQLTQILQHLHADQPPVIFRDVKPANIMLTPQQDLFLIDFGIARQFTFGKAKDTTPLGSPGYAPPEQYGRVQTTRRADIHGLGATLQTLVTGRDPLELAAGELPRNPNPPSPALRKLLDQMLSPDPEQRPVDLLDVQNRLRNIQRRAMLSFSLSDRKNQLWLVACMLVVFSDLSVESIWLGVAFLVSLGLAFGVNRSRKRFQHRGRLGRTIAVSGFICVALIWLLLISLWFWHVFGGALPF